MARWLLVALLLVGCGGEAGPPDGVSQQVVDRIESMENCDDLQGEFDQAMENAEAREPGDPARDVSIYYATVADERMREVGCYG